MKYDSAKGTYDGSLVSVVPFLIVMLARKMVFQKKKKSAAFPQGRKRNKGEGKKWYTKTEGILEV